MSTTVPLETETREALCKNGGRTNTPRILSQKVILSYSAFSIKESEEIDLIQKACDYRKGFRRISFVKPNVMEYEIEAEFIHEFLRNRSKGFAYTP
jgi:Xaa-Pro aminopeptidase